MRKLFISILAILAPLLSNAAISMKVLEDYQKQCDSGNFKKCITVGNLMNKPVKGEDIYDFDKAMSNYQKACNGGEWEACYLIAKEIINNPDNQFPEYANYDDLQKALQFNIKACDGDIARACSDLGDMYKDGFSTQINHKLSMKYYIKACDLGYNPACNETKTKTQTPIYNTSVSPDALLENATEIYKKAPSPMTAEVSYALLAGGYVVTLQQIDRDKEVCLTDVRNKAAGMLLLDKKLQKGREWFVIAEQFCGNPSGFNTWFKEEVIPEFNDETNQKTTIDDFKREYTSRH